MSKENSENQKDKPKEPKNTSVWEWVIAVVGFFLVTGTIGAMLYRASIAELTPPNLEVVVDSIAPSGDGYLVKFRVKNTGNQTAAAVTVEGELKSGVETGDTETSTATLTYVPANSTRRGGLFFTKNPRQFDLQIRATGYEEP